MKVKDSEVYKITKKAYKVFNWNTPLSY